MKGVQYYFETAELSPFYPHSVSPIHGDLTLENILYNEEKDDFKFIDQSGSRYVDAYQMDIGKLLQSILAKYNLWFTRDDLFSYSDLSFTLNPLLLQLNAEHYIWLLKEFDTNIHKAFQQGVFYLSTYFIRMIPFMLRQSKEKAYMTLCLAIYYLNTIST